MQYANDDSTQDKLQTMRKQILILKLENSDFFWGGGRY